MNQFHTLLNLFVLTLFSCTGVDSDGDRAHLVVRLDSLVRAEHNAGHFDGTMVVGNRDSILFTKATGKANRVWDIPMKSGYRFDIASVNKSFIAVLILKAVKEGRLMLDDRLSDLMGKYGYGGSFNTGITIHHLLTHTSGLPDYQAVDPELSASDFMKFKRMHFSNTGYVEFISRLGTISEPGENFHYSNFGYHLLAILLEDIYKKPFSVILEEKICVPLNLVQTFADTSNLAVHKNLVEAYRYSQRDNRWERNQFIDQTLGRRIFSTAGDMYRWAKAMDDTTLLPARSLKLLKTNHLSGISDRFSYGYGWVVFDGKKNYQMGNLDLDEPYMIHGGSTEGYKSMVININKGKWIIAFLSNIGDRTDEMSLAKKIVNLLKESSYDS